jgi:hypothetical protein
MIIDEKAESLTMRRDEIIASLKQLIKKDLLDHTYSTGKNTARLINNKPIF